MPDCTAFLYSLTARLRSPLASYALPRLIRAHVSIHAGFKVPLSAASKLSSARCQFVCSKIKQAEVVVNPGVIAIEFERRLKLLLGFGVLTFLHLLDPAARDDRNVQLVRHAQNLVIGIDFHCQRLAV